MHSNATNVATRNTAIAVARKLARDCTSDPEGKIGPEYLAAGILKAMGPDAVAILGEMGVVAVAERLKRIPCAAPDEAEHLPAAVPNESLTVLLTGRLKPFISGKVCAEEALKVLLSDPEVVTALQALVNLVSRGATSTSVMEIGETIRTLTKNLHSGYLLGRSLYSPTRSGLSIYESGAKNRELEKSAEAFYTEKHQVRRAMYSSPRGQRQSVFERYMRRFGPMAADVAFSVMMNSLAPFTDNGTPMNVREVAWALDPMRYHLIVGDVIDAAEGLKHGGVIRVLPDCEQCHLFSVLLPSQEFTGEFTGYVETSYDAIGELIAG